jgi:small subunit ribosomal protein S16
MAIKIRLRQQGKKNRQTFRLVLIDIRSKRDGKYIENLGWYNPCESQNNLNVKADRVAYWLEKGAEISHQAKSLVAKSAPEVIKTYNAKCEATRIKRVARRRAAKKKA